MASSDHIYRSNQPSALNKSVTRGRRRVRVVGNQPAPIVNKKGPAKAKSPTASAPAGALRIDNANDVPGVRDKTITKLQQGEPVLVMAATSDLAGMLRTQLDIAVSRELITKDQFNTVRVQLPPQTPTPKMKLPATSNLEKAIETGPPAPAATVTADDGRADDVTDVEAFVRSDEVTAENSEPAANTEPETPAEPETPEEPAEEAAAAEPAEEEDVDDMDDVDDIPVAEDPSPVAAEEGGEQEDDSDGQTESPEEEVAAEASDDEEDVDDVEETVK